MMIIGRRPAPDVVPPGVFAHRAVAPARQRAPSPPPIESEANFDADPFRGAPKETLGSAPERRPRGRRTRLLTVRYVDAKAENRRR